MDPTSGMAAIENPNFVAPDASGALVDNEDYVVGVTFEGKNYAYPYAALYSTPAVIHAQHDKRLLLMWSAPANRACVHRRTGGQGPRPRRRLHARQRAAAV